MPKLSKEEFVRTALTGLARKLGKNGQLPSVRDLCAKLKVSRSTLDRVLKHLKKDRILDCRHGSGIYVSPFSNQRRIAMIFGGNIHDTLLYSQFWYLIHGAVLRQADRAGDELLTYYGCPDFGGVQTDPGAYTLAEELQGGRISGVITAGIASTLSFKWLKQWNTPVISLGPGSGLTDAAVTFSTEYALKVAFEGLRDAGCRRVALVWSGGDPEQFMKGEDEMTMTFRSSLKLLDLAYDNRRRWNPIEIPPDYNWESLETAGSILVNLKLGQTDQLVNPDGICFMDDTMAHGGLISLLRLGVIIGKEMKIAVVSTKGVSLLRPFWPCIYRVEHDPDDVASRLLNALHAVLQGKSPVPMACPTCTLVQPGSR